MYVRILHSSYTRARRVQHFLDPDSHLDYTLNIFKKYFFLCLHLVIALEIRISLSVLARLIHTSGNLADNFLDYQAIIEF
jgi:hypothetical protein